MEITYEKSDDLTLVKKIQNIEIIEERYTIAQIDANIAIVEEQLAGWKNLKLKAIELEVQAIPAV